jgi:ADP-ribosylglycohydrolase
MTGFGTYNQPPGTWSDDSSMTLATVESLCRMGKIDPEDIMLNFAAWLFGAKFTPHRFVFDVGRTTRKAIHNFIYGYKIEKCGGTSENDNGNGSLMRILPLAFLNCSLGDVANVSSLTHGHSISIHACDIYVSIAQGLIAGQNIREAIAERVRRSYYLHENFNRLKALDSLSRDEIESTGFVVDTLEAALWCVLKTDNYRDCVLMAVNLGNDTDTTAAVAGGLAGILYGIGGEKGIPEDWIDQIVKRDEIKALCESFENRFDVERMR